MINTQVEKSSVSASSIVDPSSQAKLDYDVNDTHHEQEEIPSLADVLYGLDDTIT